MRASPLILLTLPAAAIAHAGHAQAGFLSGAGHPLGGTNQLLAMVALGLLAAQVGGRAMWALPLTFVGAILLGAATGARGIAFPAVEPLILASVVVLSGLVAMAARLPLAVLVAMTAVFGAAHGWAHGAEGPADGWLGRAAGFAVLAMALHLGGIVLGRAAPPPALRFVGAISGVAGLAALFGLAT